MQNDIKSTEVSSLPTCPSKMMDVVTSRIKKMLAIVTIEPLMFLMGICHWSMQVYMEIVQMNKICTTKHGFPDEICSNLTAYPEENIKVQKSFSIFALQYSVIFSVCSIILVPFLGSWSDKYGRKIPLVLSTLVNLIWSGGYLLNSWNAFWPIEILYIFSFISSLCGGAQGMLSIGISYISDVTPEETRTARVSTAMSFWYVGGPLGNLIGAVAIQFGGVNLAIAIVFVIHLTAITYVILVIKESHGPFAMVQLPPNCPKNTSDLNKEDITKMKMLRDLIDWRRLAEAFKTTFRKREGNDRAVLLAVVFSNMIRRAAKGFFMYLFVRRALGWNASSYSYWMSYRTTITALGSLVLVPFLIRLTSISDPMLIVMGSLSVIGECCCFGSVSGVSTSFLMWLGPLVGLLTNANMIAQKSLSTKLVSSNEKGRVTAVMSATQSLMPMVGYAIYSPLYNMTVETFPEAQFFFGAGMVAIIMIIFVAIIVKSATPNDKEIEAGIESTKEDKNSQEIK